MSKFLNERLACLEEYTPGEQPQDKKYIKLNTNESPYPPSDKVIEAIGKGEIEDLRLYCDPECRLLKESLANIYGVKPQSIFLSNGSDDILNFAFMAYGKEGAAFADITYGFYKVFAQLYGIDATVIPLKDDFTLDTEGFIGQNKLVVIANPNAPTGISISLNDIERILEGNRQNVVIIDEAYVDFGGATALPLIKKYPNLLCVRTFSKSRSMAGARLGFAIADEEIIKDLEKIKYSTNPYNINRLTQIAGRAALEQNDYYLNNCKRIIATRRYTEKALKDLGFSVLPSNANFLFARHNTASGKEIYEGLRQRGVLIRHFQNERIKDFNRITIGSQEEMEEFILQLKALLGEKI